MKTVTTSSRNYNIQALRGDKGQTDMDVIQEFGLDPALANTPGINDAAIEAMYQRNIENGVDAAEAAKYRMHYKKMANKLLKESK